MLVLLNIVTLFFLAIFFAISYVASFWWGVAFAIIVIAIIEIMDKEDTEGLLLDTNGGMNFFLSISLLTLIVASTILERQVFDTVTITKGHELSIKYNDIETDVSQCVYNDEMIIEYINIVFIDKILKQESVVKCNTKQVRILKEGDLNETKRK